MGSRVVLYIWAAFCLALLALGGASLRGAAARWRADEQLADPFTLVVPALIAFSVVLVGSWMLSHRDSRSWREAFPEPSRAARFVEKAPELARELRTVLAEEGQPGTELACLSDYARTLRGRSWTAPEWLGACALLGQIFVQHFGGSWTVTAVNGAKVPGVLLRKSWLVKHTLLPMHWVAEVANSDDGFDFGEVFEHFVEELS